MAQRGRETIGNESLDYNWKSIKGSRIYKTKLRDRKIEVAIKMCDGELDSWLYEKYIEEPNQYVPRVYGIYQGCPPDMGSGVDYGIVMEWMARGNLKSLLQTLSKPPPWPPAFRLAHQVALAMDFLHSRKSPRVHSCLKPYNVLLNATLNAKITHGAAILNTSNEHSSFTPAYTPPEAFKDGYHYDCSYDIYSYGILLWTILTGEVVPYPDVGRDVLQPILVKGDRPSLHTIDVQKEDEELVELMKRCWDTDPKKRPQSTECVEVTRRVFSRHKKGIDAAVSEILKQLDLETDLSIPTASSSAGGVMDPTPSEKEILDEQILGSLMELDKEGFKLFKWYLLQSSNLEGLKPLPQGTLEDADKMKTTNLIVQAYPQKKVQIMVNVLSKICREDLVLTFKQGQSYRQSSQCSRIRARGKKGPPPPLAKRKKL